MLEEFLSGGTSHDDESKSDIYFIQFGKLYLYRILRYSFFFQIIYSIQFEIFYEENCEIRKLWKKDIGTELWKKVIKEK